MYGGNERLCVNIGDNETSREGAHVKSGGLWWQSIRLGWRMGVAGEQGERVSRDATATLRVRRTASCAEALMLRDYLWRWFAWRVLC